MSESEPIEPNPAPTSATAKPRKRSSPDNPRTISAQVRAVFKGWDLPIERIARGAKLNQSVLQKFMRGKAGLSTASLDALAVKYKFRLIVEGTAPDDKPDKSKGKAKGRTGITRRKPTDSTSTTEG